MILKGLLISVTGLVVVAAILGYHPLPEGIADPYATQLVMGMFKLIQVVKSVRELLGYGSKYQDIRFIGKMTTPVGDPASAAFGDLKVTRDVLAGVPVIIYQHREVSKFRPGLVFFHGGGWVLGSADMYDAIMYEYAKQTGAVIFSVDYRLAPEHPFPVPVQDCLDVTRFVLRHGANYNVDVERVGVSGDSAGGNLAAAVALTLSREKSDLPSLLFQVLHYPAIQAFDMHLPSLIELNQTMPILSQDMMSAYWAYYLGADKDNIDHYTAVIRENRHIPAHLRKSKYAEFVDVKLLPPQYQTRRASIPAVEHDSKVYSKIKDIVTNPLFSPLMSPDLTGLPSAFIQICEFDVLRDDAFLYARRLQDAGVKVKVHFGKGGFHGDLVMYRLSGSTTGKAALFAAYTFIKEMTQ